MKVFVEDEKEEVRGDKDWVDVMVIVMIVVANGSGASFMIRVGVDDVVDDDVEELTRELDPFVDGGILVVVVVDDVLLLRLLVERLFSTVTRRDGPLVSNSPS